MLDLKLMQKNPEIVAKALKDRNSKLDMGEFQALDARRRDLLAEVESLKAQRNKASGEVAALKRAGQDASELLKTMSVVSERIKELDAQAEAAKAAVESWLMSVPNIPDDSVPVGKDENENVEVSRWGTPREFSFAPKEHWELGAALDGLDFERAGRLAGARFSVSRGWAARLERALMNFYLDVQTTEFGHTEILPPFMVNQIGRAHV